MLEHNVDKCESGSGKGWAHPSMYALGHLFPNIFEYFLNDDKAMKYDLIIKEIFFPKVTKNSTWWLRLGNNPTFGI